MGQALEIVSGRVTNPGGTITALTANTGDSFIVRSAGFEAPIILEQAWAQEGTIGVLRLLSARLHDQSQGIRLRVPATARPLLPDESLQRLYPQDALTFGLSGGGAETDIGALLIYYRDLPGIDARLATWEEIVGRIVNIMGAEQALTTGATLGDYGGSQALTADFDTFKRNVDYAILGYLTDVTVGIVGVRGSETGNLRVGGPGINDPDVTADWFVNLARRTGRPHIPIINAANIGAVTIDVAHTAAAVAVNVTLIMAELAGTVAP